jgi:hypothetical protein
LDSMKPHDFVGHEGDSKNTQELKSYTVLTKPLNDFKAEKWHDLKKKIYIYTHIYI